MNNYIVAQNVGIGIITPAAKLHIKGSVDASQLIMLSMLVFSTTLEMVNPAF